MCATWHRSSHVTCLLRNSGNVLVPRLRRRFADVSLTSGNGLESLAKNIHGSILVEGGTPAAVEHPLRTAFLHVAAERASGLR